MNEVDLTPNEHELRMSSITVEIHGVTAPLTRADAYDVAVTTEQILHNFSPRADGYTETTIGPYRITAGPRRLALHQQLGPGPHTVERMAPACWQAAEIAHRSPDKAELFTIMLEATIRTSVTEPYVARFLIDMSPEINQLEPVESRNGSVFPVWHRIAPIRENMGHEHLTLTFEYQATAAVVT